MTKHCDLCGFDGESCPQTQLSRMPSRCPFNQIEVEIQEPMAPTDVECAVCHQSYLSTFASCPFCASVSQYSPLDILNLIKEANRRCNHLTEVFRDMEDEVVAMTLPWRLGDDTDTSSKAFRSRMVEVMESGKCPENKALEWLVGQWEYWSKSTFRDRIDSLKAELEESNEPQ